MYSYICTNGWTEHVCVAWFHSNSVVVKSDHVVIYKGVCFGCYERQVVHIKVESHQVFLGNHESIDYLTEAS